MVKRQIRNAATFDWAPESHLLNKFFPHALRRSACQGWRAGVRDGFLRHTRSVFVREDISVQGTPGASTRPAVGSVRARTPMVTEQGLGSGKGATS